MPELLTNILTSDSYRPAATIGPASAVEQLTFQVFNQPIYVRLFKPVPDQESIAIEEAIERYFPAGALVQFSKVAGAAFRSANLGSPATINAELAFATDPISAYSATGLFSSAVLNLGFDHNGVPQGFEDLLDFVDSSSVVFTLTDTAGVKMAVSAAAIGRSTRQIFTANGIYVPPAGLVAALFELVGGGGGGGGCPAAAGGQGCAGAGGGGGGYSSLLLQANQLPVLGGNQIAIGAGGAGGVGANPGGNGGRTSFGVIPFPCSAFGGAGGGQGVSVAAGFSLAAPGAGGSTAAAVGDVRLGGNPGGIGTVLNAGLNTISGHGGGAARWGGGGVGLLLLAAAGALNGNNGWGPNGGGGGSGSAATAGGGATSGGNGSDGIVVVTEFY